jgi:hypothetical protein
VSLSQVQIINIGLSKIGSYYISSLTEGTKQQIYGVMHWENARDSLLQEVWWSFATDAVRLALLAGIPVGFSHQYQLPNDYLVIQKISVDGTFNDHDSIAFKIRGKTLCTDEDTIYIQYTKQITDTSLFTPLFSKILSCDLASLMAEPIAGMSEQGKTLILNEREVYMAQASGVEFEEGSNTQTNDYSMITCRDN